MKLPDGGTLTIGRADCIGLEVREDVFDGFFEGIEGWREVLGTESDVYLCDMVFVCVFLA